MESRPPKYELTDETVDSWGVILYRIRALRSFGGVDEGDLGGYVQGENNLSHDDTAWVSGAAWVFGDAQVSGAAWVSGEARVYGDAQVSGAAWVFGDARVYGDARVSGSAQVSGSTQVSGDAQVCGEARIS